ncbi:hypothetical protein [Streptomyces caniscabiei]
MWPAGDPCPSPSPPACSPPICRPRAPRCPRATRARSRPERGPPRPRPTLRTGSLSETPAPDRRPPLVLDDLVDLAGRKVAPGARRTLAEKYLTQAGLAQAKASLRAARALFCSAVEDVWQATTTHDTVPWPSATACASPRRTPPVRFPERERHPFCRTASRNSGKRARRITASASLLLLLPWTGRCRHSSGRRVSGRADGGVGPGAKRRTGRRADYGNRRTPVNPAAACRRQISLEGVAIKPRGELSSASLPRGVRVHRRAVGTEMHVGLSAKLKNYHIGANHPEVGPPRLSAAATGTCQTTAQL